MVNGEIPNSQDFWRTRIEGTNMINVHYPADHAGQIQTVDGLLDRTTCRNLLTRLEQIWDKSSPGKTLGGVFPITKLTNDLHYSPREQEEWTFEDSILDTAIFKALSSAIAIYKQAYPHLNHWVDIQDTGFQVQKYDKSAGYYREHTDSFPGTVNERVLAVIIYLNDVDFGGETNFPVHGVKVKPVQGRICLFPAVFTHPHESCVPITGDKWIISSFVNHVKQTPEEHHSDGHIHDENDAPHTHFDDAFSHPHDEQWNHPHEASPPLILGQAIEPSLDWDDDVQLEDKVRREQIEQSV